MVNLYRLIMNQFTTKDEMAQHCIKAIKETLFISYEKDLIIDPCAQNEEGLFLKPIDALVRFSLFYDKEPKHTHISAADLLTTDFDYFEKTRLAGLWYDAIHVVSCPPPHLIEQFVTATCKFAQSVSFLSSVKPGKHTFPPNFFLMYEEKIMLNKTPYYFQIWIKADL